MKNRQNKLNEIGGSLKPSNLYFRRARIGPKKGGLGVKGQHDNNNNFLELSGMRGDSTKAE